jgi:hypothetical protein
MNDKWFNMAMIIVLTSFVANALVFMLLSMPGGAQFNTLYQTNLDYDADENSVRMAYEPNVSDEQVLAPGAADSTGTGYIPFTNNKTSKPVGLDPITLITTGFVGLEVLLLSLGNIFPMFSGLFSLFALLAFTVKVIVVAYFGSLLIRAMFGGRT